MGYRVATTAMRSPIGELRLAATDEGLVRIAFPRGSGSSFAGWLGETLGQFEKVDELPVLDEAVRQLAAYFAHELETFDLPLDLRGTEFQKSVWQALLEIPYGTTQSYGELATQLGNPKASRAVGSANGRNPVPIVVPCHRVIQGSGRLGGFGGGLDTKRHLLALERSGSLL